MRKIDFTTSSTSEIESLLRKGLTGYGFNVIPGGAINVLWLFIQGGEILGVCSLMVEIDNSWDEIGSLELAYISEKDATSRGDINLLKVSLPKQWLNIASVDRLIYEDEKVEVECGFSIKSNNGECFTFTSSALPGTIAVSAPFSSRDFDPEFDFKSYKIGS